MSIGEICNREVIVIRTEETLEEAVALMRRHHVGDLVVVEESGSGRCPVGILTDRDILIKVVGEDLAIQDLDVVDVMTAQPVVGLESDDLPDTIKRMREHQIRRLPVVDNEKRLVGILTCDDIIDLLADELSDLAMLVRNQQLREASRTVGTPAFSE